MSVRVWNIFVVTVALVSAAVVWPAAGTARAQEAAAAAEVAQGADNVGAGVGTDVLTRPPRGSLAAQLRLKLSLQMTGGTSLAASMDHNRQDWEMLSPEQRERFRGMAVAFLDKDPKEQEKLLRSYSAFLSLDKQKREQYRARADWVRTVVASFTPQERKQLESMSSMDRAKAIIARRDELVSQGKLQLQPTTRPATEPAK
jgi:hypothetical protein